MLGEADDTIAAAPFCVWVLGALGVGKSTVSRALQLLLRMPLIELGNLREMHLLEPDWSDASDAEAALAFDHMLYIVRSYLTCGHSGVLATDLPLAQSEQIADLMSTGLNTRVLTLVITDPDEHRTRLLGPRDSGFRDVEAARKWNAAELYRPMLPFEHRLDTTGQSSEETVAIAESVIRNWLESAAY